MGQLGRVVTVSCRMGEHAALLEPPAWLQAQPGLVPSMQGCCGLSWQKAELGGLEGSLFQPLPETKDADGSFF